MSVYFALTTFTAPVSGVIVGGILTSKLGGYNSLKSLKLMKVLGVCAVSCALPIPFMDSFLWAGTFIWLLLFFGGSILPSLTGIMISSVGEFEKSQANSIANSAYNFLGYLPAPLVYGMVA